MTKAGEMWDEIAKRELGSEKYLVDLARANRQYINVFKFSAGVKLEMPQIETPKATQLPPWRQ